MLNMSIQSETVAEKPSEQSVVHTPGPWKYVPSTATVRAMDRFTVCEVRGWGRLTSMHGVANATDQMDANGRILAASLDMFRIIQRLATADWIGEAELNLWRKESRDIMRQVV